MMKSDKTQDIVLTSIKNSVSNLITKYESLANDINRTKNSLNQNTNTGYFTALNDAKTAITIDIESYKILFL